MTAKLPADWRDIRNGAEIPTESYSDQPYIVTTDDNAWLCAVTTGQGHEGQSGQHVITMRSTDQGKTWSDPINVEPADGPEASYAVILKAPSDTPNAGRIFIFYNHNTDNIRKVRADPASYPDGFCHRVDSLGHFVLKFSDDHGQTWSEDRIDIPMRTMDIDRQNPYGGELKFFWNVGRPFAHEGAAFVSLHKVGGFGEGFFTRSEGVLLKSADLFAVTDPATATWETLPDGDFGLRPPSGGGPIAEEQSYSILSDGAFYAVYRTIDGYPVESYSRDGGHTWSAPQYKRYATPDHNHKERRMKHPRAANFAWRLSHGTYLYWYHNHGGRFIRDHPRRRTIAYEDRNPVWFSVGTERDTPAGKVLAWSEPEIGLYDDDPYIRISYPDLVETAGRVFLTETQKDIARVHEIPQAFLEALSSQTAVSAIATEGLTLTLPEAGKSMPSSTAMPSLPAFVTRDQSRKDYGTRDLRQGFSIALWVRPDTLTAGQILLDNRTESRQGFCLQTTHRATLEIVLNDGRTENRWECDPDLLAAGKTHHVVVTVDGGPNIITFIVDGRFNDGGDFRQFGWGRFSPNLRDVNGSDTLRIGPKLQGEVYSLRLYNRCLLTTEAIRNYRAGLANHSTGTKAP
jgi:hypothetical protein